MERALKNRQYIKFSLYGFLRNLRFFDAFLLLFLLHRGMSYTQVGVLYAVREISTNLLEIPSGVLADAFGRRRSLAGSFLLYILSFVVFSFSGQFWVYLLAFLLFGMAEAFRSGTHKGMIMDYLRRKGWEAHKVDYYGHTRSWSQRGSALSALVAGLLVFSGGSYDRIFLWSVIPYLLLLGLMISYPRELDIAIDPAGKGAGERIRQSLRMLRDALSKRRVRAIVHSSALHSAFLKAIKDYIQMVMIHLAAVLPFVRGTGEEERNGLVVGGLYFLLFLVNAQASRFSGRLGVGSRFTLLLGLAFGALSGLAFRLEWWLPSLLLFAAVYAVENIRKPILTGEVAEAVPGEILTSVLSAQSLWQTLLAAGIALGFGALADAAGLGTSLLIVPLVLLLSALPALGKKPGPAG
ncbi:MAG: MFS transporter [Bacteroidales bacterium]